MNYIELINNYWQLREQGMLNGSEGDLYLYLLHTSNKLGWKNPFNQSNALICAMLNISEPTLIRHRNSLKQLALLDFESGKAVKRNTQYYLNYLSSDISSVVSSSVSNPVSRVVENSLDNNKHKQNNNINNICGEEKSKRFSPPTLEEVKNYCLERKNSVDAQRFIDFYTSKDWMIGKNKMKDWKAAVRTWEKDKKGYTHPAASYNPEPTECDPRFGQ